ncbi:NAD(P)-dependent dehydrogenase (short-subunit alcohol dehydrogenase family) [Ensifer mexicanus]|uniref:SDR family NAD(P)-dependent oxidoreductase n=1 Tax=Sinorhizobium mexicanum TaxID=375549 RepID=A0A859QGP6_9HYPH|nr:NAD(P)-dependent dehydrogenase (short-subunit alcohol dehydrogenase family) [Sinorhizobium mexicanum]QLL65863.1 SDR family NAD(P)-dependent oxidoreductase [Sinorhizobium mexicanum]
MKTWFITGASRGFGARIAELALAQGDNVVASARNPRTVTERLGDHPNLLPIVLDVTDGEQAKAAANAAVEHFGRIDVLLKWAPAARGRDHFRFAPHCGHPVDRTLIPEAAVL